MAYSHAYLGVVDLGKDVYWNNEDEWTPHTQTVRKAVDGNLVVERLPAYTDGRPMTLLCTGVTKAVCDAVRNLRDSLTQNILPLTLTDGRIYSVLFSHHNGPPVSVTPAVVRPDYINQSSPDHYDLQIKLFEVSSLTTTTT